MRRRPSVCGVETAPHFGTPGAKATDFSRFGAHLYPVKKMKKISKIMAEAPIQWKY